MCPVYFESIRVADGKVFHLNYHQRRVERISAVQLQEAVDRVSLPQKGLYKLRISYTPTAILRTDIQAYTPKDIDSLKGVYDDHIDYSLKSEDRSALNRLHRLRESCDDVLIIKNGRITDTSYCNILFSDGAKWITSDTPLLEGTCRARLIEEGKIGVEEIRVTDLHAFKYYMLVNAMLDFDEQRRKQMSSLYL